MSCADAWPGQDGPGLSLQDHSRIGACRRQAPPVTVCLHQVAALRLDDGDRLVVELVEPVAGDSPAEEPPGIGPAPPFTARHGLEARQVLDLGKLFIRQLDPEKIEQAARRPRKVFEKILVSHLVQEVAKTGLELLYATRA